MKGLPNLNRSTNGILWNRLKYVLSPQFDTYQNVAKVVRGKVADIGFGTGFGTHLLTQRADEIFAFEIDKEAVRFARKVFPFNKLHFEYGNILNGISSDYGLFNFVVMIDVIEHIEKDREAVENAKKCLVEKGFLICSTPNRLSRYRKSANHIREYSPEELEKLLKGVFRVVDIVNYKLHKIKSDYENPIMGICCK